MSGPYGILEVLWLWKLLNRKFPKGSPFRPTEQQLMTLLDELDELDEFKAQQKSLKF